MTTIVNSPTPNQGATNDSSGSGFLIGTIVFIIFLVVVVYFGLPALNNSRTQQADTPTTQINVESPQVSEPDEVEVAPTE